VGGAVDEVRIRLFAAARDAAGRASDSVPVAHLGAVLEELQRRYGPEFAAVLATARVWVNGDEPVDGPASILRPGDEVAILPPVSGG
jgi:molybdopterin synthase sulfur carrier subunit